MDAAGWEVGMVEMEVVLVVSSAVMWRRELMRRWNEPGDVLLVEGKCAVLEVAESE